MVDEGSQRVRPGVTALAQIKPEGPPDLLGSLDDWYRGRQRPDEVDLIFPGHLGEVPVPLLSLLTLEDRVEEVGARAGHPGVAHRPVVGDRNLFLGWLREEQEADRRVRRTGEVFELLERRSPLSAIPLGELGELASQVVDAQSSSLACPCEQPRLNGSAHRSGHHVTVPSGCDGLSSELGASTSAWGSRVAMILR